jgi:hypothetical protein
MLSLVPLLPTNKSIPKMTAKLSTKIYRNLPYVLINRPRDRTQRAGSNDGPRQSRTELSGPSIPTPPIPLAHQVPNVIPSVEDVLECPSVARSPGGLSRAILYFRGLGRQPIWKVRLFFKKLKIPDDAIQFVSFIGANVAELILLGHFREEVIRKLGSKGVKYDPNFDPLSPRSFTNVATIKRLGLVNKSEEERSVVARKAFVSRLDSMLEKVTGHRRGLGSFLRSLKKAVLKDSPVKRFFNPTT